MQRALHPLSNLNAKLRREHGGAALEYILVSTFAAIVTLAALAFIGKVVREQLQTMADKLGVEADVGDLGGFGE